MKRLELSELAAYAENRYHIREERQWKDHSNFSVLVHPMTGKWVAILMREWNSITGEQLERCDIKCGRQALSVATPYLREPFRMKSPYWLGVEIGRVTTPTTVFELLDQAMQAENNRATEIVIPPRAKGGYRDTPLATHVDSRTPSAAPASVLAFSKRADFFSAAPSVDGAAGVMGIFLTDRSLFVVAVKDTGQMVAGLTFFCEAFFANAVSGFPSRHFGAVIGVRAAVSDIIGLASVCKEVFRVFALDFTRACFFVALCRGFACLHGFPSFGHALRKHVPIT